ncbi:hypothetical protein [Streptomyces sp. NPDC093707]|uniref:hypothetical protein n=1 Tax=Streptomyces sp. NPDC093707 TaxID=3154984 RepID=UPI00344C60DC
MLSGNAPCPRLRWAVRHPFKALDRQGIAPWQAIAAALVSGGVTTWLVDVYLSMRR